jgi:hypothetical protein
MHSLTPPLLAALLLLPPSPLLAQAAVDPSGHWEGAVYAPNMVVNIEIDLAKNANGELAGTFGQPAQQVRGLPFSKIATEGSAVTLQLRAGTGGGTFTGTVMSDGRTMSGDFVTAEGGYSVPFSLARTGDARTAPAPKSRPIGRELEGTWNGTLDVDGGQMRLVVKMANQPDGTAIGTIVSPDGSGVEIPIAMAQSASRVTVDVPSVGASFVGVLNVAATEMVGTWTQATTTLALTLRRGQ